jgi:hypothetical protein
VSFRKCRNGKTDAIRKDVRLLFFNEVTTFLKGFWRREIGPHLNLFDFAWRICQK